MNVEFGEARSFDHAMDFLAEQVMQLGFDAVDMPICHVREP